MFILDSVEEMRAKISEEIDLKRAKEFGAMRVRADVGWASQREGFECVREKVEREEEEEEKTW